MEDLDKMVFDLASEIHGVQKAPDPEAFVGNIEAAEILGYSTGYLKRLCRERKVPCYQARPGAHYRFLVSELRAFLRGEWEAEG